MTITYYAGRLMHGTASERSGLSTTNLPAGWRFFETDTYLMKYWDASNWQNLTRAPFIFIANRAISTASQTAYGGPMTRHESGWATTESVRQIPCRFTLAPVQATVRIAANTLNGTVTISFRDDAADVTNSSIAVLTSDTSGTKTSSAITAIIAAGSMINWKYANAGTTGSADLEMILEGYMYA